MNINDFILAGKLAGSSGSGGNPNSVQVITGTANNVLPNWNNSEWNALTVAVANHNATVIVELDLSAVGANPYSANFLSETTGIMFETYAGFDLNGNPSINEANTAAIVWGSDLVTFASIIFYDGNTFTELATDYYSVIPTTLTIYWHPMPEE